MSERARLNYAADWPIRGNYDSSAVVSDRDGNVLERTEFIIDTLLGGIQLRIQQSDSGTVEENAFEMFNISVFDIDGGAITSDDIDITAIGSTPLSKSTGGADFSTAGLTQPVFSKANGRIYCSYQFKSAEWVVGDLYRLVVSGITATIDGDVAYVPTMVWSNVVLEAANLDANVGHRPDVAPPMSATPSDTDTVIQHLKAIRETIGQTPNDPDDSVLTNVGQRDDTATNDDMSDITTTSLQAKIRLLLNRLSLDAFTATIQGIARTELDTMIAQLATYLVASGGAMSIQVNNNVARTNLEQAIEDLLAVIGCDGTNVFNPSIGGSARTTFETAFEALGNYLDAEFISYKLNYLAATPTASADMTTEVIDGSIISRMLSKTSDTSSYDPTTDAQEAISDKIGAFTGDGGVAQDDSAKASLDLLHTDGDNIISELAKVPKSDSNVTWNETAKQTIQTESEDALNAFKLEYVSATPTSGADMTPEVVDGSVISRIISKTSNTSTYDPTTDSLEMISDKTGGFSGDGGTDQDDSTKASLDLLHTDSDAIISELAKVPKSDSNVTWNETAKQMIQTEDEDALKAFKFDYISATPTVATDMTAEVVDGSVISRMLSKISDTSTYEPSTDSQEMISDKLGSFTGDGGMAQDDSAKASLDLLHTAINALKGENGIFYEQSATPLSYSVGSISETTIFDLSTASTRYIVRSLCLKCTTDPGADTVTIKLYELINDAITPIDTFVINTGNYASYFSLVDMFGISQLAGDNLKVTAQTSANNYTINGQLSYGKTNNT